MKAYTYINKGVFLLTDKPIPSLQEPTDAIVRVTLSSIAHTDGIKHRFDVVIAIGTAAYHVQTQIDFGIRKNNHTHTINFCKDTRFFAKKQRIRC